MNKEETNSKSEKWFKDQIEVLINAFKDEQCLYASDLPTYRNKRLREAALERVCQKVLRLRPTTTTEECQKKFKNIRNQFNIENMKVKASIKNATGPADDVYIPNLWYYSLLLFLDSYVTPRKHRNSLERDVQNTNLRSPSTVLYIPESQIINNDGDLDQQQQFHETTVGKNLTLVSEDISLSAQRNIASPTISISSNSDAPQNSSTVIMPGPISPALSTSTSGISSVSQRRSKKRNRRSLTRDDFSGAINNLAKSLKQPIVISNIHDTMRSSADPSINGLLSFVGAMLQSFQDEELKLEVMSTLTQTVINARSLDLKRARK